MCRGSAAGCSARARLGHEVTLLVLMEPSGGDGAWSPLRCWSRIRHVCERPWVHRRGVQVMLVGFKEALWSKKH